MADPSRAGVLDTRTARIVATKHWAYSWHPFADCSKREGPTISATRQPGGGVAGRTVDSSRICQNSTTL